MTNTIENDKIIKIKNKLMNSLKQDDFFKDYKHFPIIEKEFNDFDIELLNYITNLENYMNIYVFQKIQNNKEKEKKDYDNNIKEIKDKLIEYSKDIFDLYRETNNEKLLTINENTSYKLIDYLEKTDKELNIDYYDIFINKILSNEELIYFYKRIGDSKNKNLLFNKDFTSLFSNKIIKNNIHNMIKGYFKKRIIFFELIDAHIFKFFNEDDKKLMINSFSYEELSNNFTLHNVDQQNIKNFFKSDNNDEIKKLLLDKLINFQNYYYNNKKSIYINKTLANEIKVILEDFNITSFKERLELKNKTNIYTNKKSVIKRTNKL